MMGWKSGFLLDPPNVTILRDSVAGHDSAQQLTLAIGIQSVPPRKKVPRRQLAHGVIVFLTVYTSM